LSHQLGLSAVPTILYITIKPYVLCSALPPSALLYQAKASCYCGKIKMSIKTDEPVFAAFCHCVCCRKAHSAPLFQVVYVKPDEITIEGGMDESNPNLASKGGQGHLGAQDNGSKVLGIVHRRVFCNDCGSIMFNDLNILDENSLGMEAQKIIGTFPGTYDTPMREMLQSWQPKFHVYTEDAILDVPSIKDGLPKFTAGAGTPLFEGTA
jgi:hypothetical protein